MNWGQRVLICCGRRRCAGMGVEQHRRLRRTAARAVLLPAGLSSCRSEGGPREGQRAKGGATQVEGFWRRDSQTCRAGRAKLPRKATNLALVVYDAAYSETALLVGTWCKRISTQARSCWLQGQTLKRGLKGSNRFRESVYWAIHKSNSIFEARI